MPEQPGEPVGKGTGWLGGRYGRLLLPAVIFQSVLIGGGYATGREIVEFGGRLGSAGLWSIAAAISGFALTAAVAYEYARTFRLYNYRAFMRRLIGPFWPLFDILFLIMVVIVIAVMASAAGEMGRITLGLPYAAGVGLVVAAVAYFNFSGARFIEGAKSIGTVVLYGAYLVFSGVVLSDRWRDTLSVLLPGTWGPDAGAPGTALRSDPGLVEGAVTSGAAAAAATPGASLWLALGIGVLYVAYNITAIPAVLFSLHRQERTRDAVVAGVWTGVLAVVPFFLTYLCLMGFYPDPSVMGAEIPWLVMLERTGGPALMTLFTVVVTYTLVETATGQTHALSDRVDDSLRELGRAGLTAGQSALFTGSVVAVSALLSNFGIIALVARGYTAMAYGFLVIFALPLLTVGVAQILRERNRRAKQAARFPHTEGSAGPTARTEGSSTPS